MRWPIKTAAFISRLSKRMKDLGQQDRCCSSDQCPRCVLTGFTWRSWIKHVPGLCQWHCGERGVETLLWAGNANRMRAGLEGLAVVSRVRLLQIKIKMDRLLGFQSASGYFYKGITVWNQHFSLETRQRIVAQYGHCIILSFNASYYSWLPLVFWMKLKVAHLLS